ncbi:MAG: adenosylcobinamide-phosphate synthase CbiB [Bacillota bacterium]
MIYILIGGVIIDLVIGDPDFISHPVVLIGKIISFLEGRLINNSKTKMNEILRGSILTIIVVLMSYFSIFFFLKMAYNINQFFGIILNIYLFSTTIAIKGLAEAGNGIYQALKSGDIELARQKTAMIVGRDTEEISKSDIIRATVETIAENTSDGIIAPLFFFFLGGVPLAMTYKAVNTMDSMLGHKNEKYLNFGKPSAKLDDLLNYIPARITAFIFGIIALFPNYDSKKAWKIIKRDAKKHPSPNAGYPEAAAAGALSIRLGGVNYYQGKKEFRAYLGDDLAPQNINEIKRMINLMYYSTAFFIIIMILLDMI